jgi:hypothetical protein
MMCQVVQGRSQKLQLGGGFGDGTREGPKAPSAARSAAWEGSGEGRPPQLWGFGGITPENFLKFIIQIRAF